jgi:hypothetical protein
VTNRRTHEHLASRRSYAADFAVVRSLLVERACAERCALLLVHGHGHGDAVDFSETDLRSHERGYSALLDLADGMPVGALVITNRAVAGDIWPPDGSQAPLAHTVMLDTNITTMHPHPLATSP